MLPQVALLSPRRRLTVRLYLPPEVYLEHPVDDGWCNITARRCNHTKGQTRCGYTSHPQTQAARGRVCLAYPLGQQPEQVGKRGQNGEDREGQQGAQPE